MDLIDGLRSTGAIREFADRPVDARVIARVLDAARFAPNGGNQQAWHVIVVDDPAARRQIRDLYVEVWGEYLAQRAAGIQPWAPIGDRDAEAAAIAVAVERREAAAHEGVTLEIDDFADRFDEVPVMLVVLADLRRLAALDRDLGRYTLVGGASVYPFVWSILLAAHAEGLGGVITTMAILREPALKSILAVPDEFAVAAVLALGHPLHRPTRLRRGAVSSFTTVDTFDGARFADPPVAQTQPRVAHRGRSDADGAPND